MLHRAQEAETTTRALARVFPDPVHAVHHLPLPAHDHFADEGAANHMRMGARQGGPGVEVFVYGRRASEIRAGFPARQTLEALIAQEGHFRGVESRRVAKLAYLSANGGDPPGEERAIAREKIDELASAIPGAMSASTAMTPTRTEKRFMNPFVRRGSQELANRT